MEGRKIALILALVCASLASFLVYKTMINNAKPKAVPVSQVSVVYAKTLIPAHSVVSAAQLEVKKIPMEAVNPGAVFKIEEIAGLIAKTDILEGEQINPNRLFHKGETVGLAFLIPSGMRAITVAVNEVAGVAGFIKPGEKVDVIGTMEPKKSADGSVSWTVIQNAAVLAVAQNLGEVPKGENKYGESGDSKEQGKISTSVTLAVTPVQAEKIALAEERGQLRLTLRPVLHEPEVKLNPIKESALIPYAGEPQPPARSNPAPAVTPRGKQIEVISGGKTQVITVY